MQNIEEIIKAGMANLPEGKETEWCTFSCHVRNTDQGITMVSPCLTLGANFPGLQNDLANMRYFNVWYRRLWRWLVG